jgi:ATP-dependent DNA helicase PIF1
VAALPPRGTFVTASTGIAALAISGTTLHSFAGIGLGKEPAAALICRVQKNERSLKRWRDARVLIVDEISMIDGALFEKLDAIARAVRRQPSLPFGGIQLVLSGDFLQLPPVSKTGAAAAAFCFQTAAWAKAALTVLQLTRVFRQDERDFVDMLHELRRGVCSESARALLREAAERQCAPGADGIEPTRLFTLKRKVEELNAARLAALKGKFVDFAAHNSGNPTHVAALAKNCQVPETLRLKVGAQVMLVKNLDVAEGLANGSRGVVVGFREVGALAAAGSRDWKAVSRKQLWPVVRFAGKATTRVICPADWEVRVQKKVVARKVQVPLILAWSLTVHKCQGMSLDRVDLSLANCFEYGQAYVALSRVRTLAGLKLRDFDPQTVNASPAAKAFYQKLHDSEIGKLEKEEEEKARARRPDVAPDFDEDELEAMFENQ